MKAFAMRWPEDLLTLTKQAAADAGTSLTAYVREATEAKLGLPTRPVAVPRETRSIIRPVADECAHPFRDASGRCRLCGTTP